MFCTLAPETRTAHFFVSLIMSETLIIVTQKYQVKSRNPGGDKPAKPQHCYHLHSSILANPVGTVFSKNVTLTNAGGLMYKDPVRTEQ